MVELDSLSRLTGRRILAKAEYLNPGGTGKDRIARAMIEEAEERGLLGPGGVVVEGTSGSTGIALAALCASRGYRCVIVMPDDQAEEKRRLLQRFGAEVLVGVGGWIGVCVRVRVCKSKYVRLACTGVSVCVRARARKSHAHHLLLPCCAMQVRTVRTAAIANPDHYVNVAREVP